LLSFPLHFPFPEQSILAEWMAYKNLIAIQSDRETKTPYFSHIAGKKELWNRIYLQNIEIE
jgi:hypothetical protein